MYNADTVIEIQRIEQLKHRHQLFSEAYAEAKRVYRCLSIWRDGSGPLELSVPFKPVHLYMHVLPGFNTYFAPAKYTGWRRLRAVDVDCDPENTSNVKFVINIAYLREHNI